LNDIVEKLKTSPNRDSVVWRDLFSKTPSELVEITTSAFIG